MYYSLGKFSNLPETEGSHNYERIMVLFRRFLEGIIKRGLLLKKSSLLLFSLVLLSSPVVLAHPHIFIDNHVTIVINEKGLTGFQLKWVFDEMTGTGFILDYDANKDGNLDKQEEKVLKAEAFDYLRNYHYMVSISIDNRDFEVKYVKDFSAKIENNMLSYSFFIPCHVSATTINKQVRMAVFDQEYFVDYALDKDIRINSANSVSYTYKIEKNLSKTFYCGQINPTEIVLYFKKK